MIENYLIIYYLADGNYNNLREFSVKILKFYQIKLFLIKLITVYYASTIKDLFTYENSY